VLEILSKAADADDLVQIQAILKEHVLGYQSPQVLSPASVY
jgi:hypothetical protein